MIFSENRMTLFRIMRQNWLKSWAQTAIMPTNSVMDVSAAASSTKIRNMDRLPLFWNIERTLFLFCSGVKEG
jgi:hypothetical protein